MSKVTDGRFRGRLKAAFEIMAINRGLIYDRSKMAGVDVAVMLLSLARVLPEADREDCLLLAQKAMSLKPADPADLSTDQMEESRGEQEAGLLFRKYGLNAYTRLVSDHDFLGEHEEAERIKKQDTKRNVKIAGCIVLVAVLAIVIYNLPYFAEARMYGKVEKAFEEKQNDQYVNIVDAYLRVYPEGRHKEEVLMFPVKAYLDADSVIPALNAASRYLKECPEGHNSSYVKGIYNKIWDAEIAKYDRLAAMKATVEGADFVRKMLRYMRENEVRNVYVASEPVLDLKEYEEYPKAVRELIELQSEGQRFTPSNSMHSIKDKINKKETDKWTDHIINSLQSGFDKVLTPGFLKFSKMPTMETEDLYTAPKAKVTYRISTQEFEAGGMTFPDIWVHTRKNGFIVMDGGLYLGISLDFSGNFSIPGESGGFEVEAQGDPGSEDFNDINPSEVYTKMCQRCTIKFTDKIESAFGIETE